MLRNLDKIVYMIVHKDYIIYRRDVRDLQMYVHSSKKTTAPKATIALAALYVQQSNEMKNLFETSDISRVRIICLLSGTGSSRERISLSLGNNFALEGCFPTNFCRGRFSYMFSSDN